MSREEHDSSTDHGSGEPASSSTDDELLSAARKAFNEAGSSILSSARLTPPQTIGGYRIVSVLGEGGMGTVFEAEQQDPRRPVALKVVRGGHYVDDHYVRLFQREAQTLARLKHQGIAAIYEAGHTAEGQHFFAMELVRGVPLNRYLRDNKLELRSRLQLFCKICDAINYAHQRGVIHRDLKPSNILIDVDGQPKILDFGLARITDVDIAVTTVVTEVGKIQGTLPYMSPEQARGNPDEIDLRSDVYSLGVILFELITEELPYDVEHTVLPEAVRIICHDEPRKPSSLSRALRGDMETIVLKALAKEPFRRYHSAAALEEDIERYLANQPILARPPSTMYQLRKLVARHKAPCAFLAALFVLVAGFGVWMRILYRAEQAQRRLAVENLSRAEEAERRAGAEAEAAKQVSGFLVELFTNPDPDKASAETITAREILDRGAQKIADELKGQPETQATLMNTMGTVYRNLGLYDRATELLEEALDIRRRTFGEKHEAVAESLNNLGWLCKIKGNYTEAEWLVSKALATRRELLGNEHSDVASSLLILATVRRYKGDYAGAEPLIREALAIQRHLLGSEHESVAGSLETLGEVLGEQGVHVEAEDVLVEALEMRRKLLGAKHPFVASTLSALASVLRLQGEYARGEALTREALAIYRDSLGDNHPYVADVLGLLGTLLRDQGDYAAADPPLREAVAICRGRLQYDHPYVANSLSNLAWLRYDTGDYAEAERRFSEALTLYRTRLGEQHPKLGDAMLGLAEVVLAQGDPERAEPLLREALGIWRRTLPEDHWSTASAESVLGACLAALHRYEDAEPLVLRGHEAMRVLRPADDRYVLESLNRIVNLYIAWGKPEKAAEYSTLLRAPHTGDRSSDQGP